MKAAQLKFTNIINLFFFYSPPYNIFSCQMMTAQNTTNLISLRSYQIVTKIQQGAQAIIFLARKKENLHAIKVYKHGQTGKKFYQNQINILDSINDQLIVKPIQISDQEVNISDTKIEEVGQPFLVMKYYINGDLRHYMNSGPIPLRIRNHIIKNIANCLIAIQICGVLHCDIKPQNFLIDQHFQLRLIDFAMGIFAKNVNQELVGSSNYIAPQIYKSRNYSYKSEIFALGVICFQLAFSNKHYFPFAAAKNLDGNFLLIQQKMYSKFWTKFPSNQIDPTYKRFLQKLLSSNPEQRPSAAQILQQNFLKESASQEECRIFFQENRPRLLFQEFDISNTI